jgi:hypothetical protein
VENQLSHDAQVGNFLDLPGKGVNGDETITYTRKMVLHERIGSRTQRLVSVQKVSTHATARQFRLWGRASVTLLNHNLRTKETA